MDLFSVRSLPFLTRRNYYFEVKHLLPWGILAGLVEGYFASIVVSKTFHGSERLIAIASATPPAAYLFSLFWGMLCVGRPKIRLFAFFAGGTVLLAGTIGAIPATPGGAIWFICQMAAAQVLLSAVVTVRSAVWRSNYPRAVRGRITARLETVRFILSIVTVLVAARLCDRDPMAYRFIFPAAAVFGSLGVLLLKNIHVRGERSELRRHEGTACDGEVRFRLTEPFSLTALLSPGHVFGRMLQVLRSDRRFAQYCLAQSFTGVANLMTIPVVVMVVTRRIDLGFAWGFWISTALVEVIPRLLRIGSIRRWARLFDRVGVVRFRVVNVSCWVLSLLLGLAATLVATHGEGFGTMALPLATLLFAIRGIGVGVGFGGGAIAWTIGHLHFAKAEDAEVYMGIHVFLTGLRGIASPLLGMWLFSVIDWGVWVVAIACATVSLILFCRMARHETPEVS